MLRTTQRNLLTIGLALLAVTTAAHARQTDPADLAKARRLVDQSRQLVKIAHRHDPHGFGGHEAKAADLLRRAALQLNEAHDFRAYNSGKSPRVIHTVSRRNNASGAAQQRVSG